MKIFENSKKIDLSIILVNYQSLFYLEKCLFSVYQNIPQNITTEIIVVNNDHDNIDALKNKFPEIKIIENRENIGFGSAGNIGAQTASGEILLFLNPDTLVTEDIFTPILNEFRRDKSVGIIGPALISEEKNIQPWSVGETPTLWNILNNNLGSVRKKELWESKIKKYVDWVAGTALFIRKNIFSKINGFDEKFFMYFEDVDLCQRVRKENYRILYFPLAKVMHFGGESYADKKIQKEQFYASQNYYFEKHRPKIEQFLIRFIRKLFNV